MASKVNGYNIPIMLIMGIITPIVLSAGYADSYNQHVKSQRGIHLPNQNFQYMQIHL